MATRNIVPRNNNEGKIGTGAKSWNAVNATDLYGKLQLQDYTESTSVASDDYIVIYDQSNSEVRRVSVSNFGTGGINTIDVRANEISLDETDTGNERGSVFGMFESIDFPNSANGAVWYSFKFPEEWSVDSDINLKLTYSMTGNDPGKIVKITTDAWLIENGDQPSASVSDYSGSDNIETTSDNIGKYAISTLSSGSVTSANVPVGCLSVVIKLTRDVGNDTYTGDMNLIAVEISQ